LFQIIKFVGCTAYYFFLAVFVLFGSDKLNAREQPKKTKVEEVKKKG
jgi:hypothetical protein